MTELKTLKDIFPCAMLKRRCKKDNAESHICLNCKLRWKQQEEAIKWVKYYKEDCEMCKALKKKSSIDYSCMFAFMHFFNITKEDLK